MPLIKRVKEIKNTDAFDSFNWAGSDLRKLNLIYGWNGSGKTTISRIFSFLERRQIHLPDLSTVEFSVVTTGGTEKTQDVATQSLPIRVFNEDFVKDNLAFHASTAKKIVMLGEENIKLQGEIATLVAEQGVQQRECDGLVAKRSRLPKTDAALTEAAREVTKRFGNTPLANDEYYGRNYTRTKVEDTLSSGGITENNVAELILSGVQLETLRDVITSDRKKVAQTFERIGDDCAGAFSAANGLLRAMVTVKDIEALGSDEELRVWTETGYRLHTERGETSCLF